MAWYNKYRPANFAQASGQVLVKKVLQNSVKSVFSSNPKVKHAYLFSGPRGTGKTSLARIFAKAINCTDQKSTDLGEACGICDVCKNGQIDIIELDAASNSGVDNIRELIEAANTPPFISRYKIYIIDEVHMLSKAAMNALLKTLEEPPSYIVFLMATTDPEKILTTILSRVTHLKLINHSLGDISKLLLEICGKENQVVDPAAINLIAKMAAGGLRDAINLLETVTNYGLDTYAETEVAQILGVLPSFRLQELADAFLSSDLSALKVNIATFEDLGVDPELLLSQLLDYLLTLSLENYLEPKNHIDSHQYKDLIQVLADLLSQNLAVASIKSALILIKIRLGDDYGELAPSNENKQKPKSISQPVLLNQTESSTLSGSSEGTKTAQFQNIPEPNLNQNQAPEPVTQNIPNSSLAKSLNGEVIQSDFMSLVDSNLRTDKTAPGKIKMVFGLLAFQDTDTIYLYAPSKIAIMQLKSPDVNKWFLKLVQENYGQNFGLKIVLEEDMEFGKIKDLIQKPSKSAPVAAQNGKTTVNEHTNPAPKLGVEPKPESKPEPKVLDTPLQEASNPDFKLSDFYYLYGPLKDGSVPEGMKLLSEKVATSQITQNTENAENTQLNSKIDHWQSELDDLDLE